MNNTQPQERSIYSTPVGTVSFYALTRPVAYEKDGVKGAERYKIQLTYGTTDPALSTFEQQLSSMELPLLKRKLNKETGEMQATITLSCAQQPVVMDNTNSPILPSEIPNLWMGTDSATAYATFTVHQAKNGNNYMRLQGVQLVSVQFGERKDVGENAEYNAEIREAILRKHAELNNNQ